MRMMLEIINSCLSNSLHHNPNLVYTLLYQRSLFTQLLAHSTFHDIVANIDLVSTDLLYLLRGGYSFSSVSLFVCW